MRQFLFCFILILSTTSFAGESNENSIEETILSNLTRPFQGLIAPVINDILPQILEPRNVALSVYDNQKKWLGSASRICSLGVGTMNDDQDWYITAAHVVPLGAVNLSSTEGQLRLEMIDDSKDLALLSGQKSGRPCSILQPQLSVIPSYDAESSMDLA
ncbi:MAG: hypothetical protein ABL927_09740, partial [Bdellovibrionales bacterium]